MSGDRFGIGSWRGLAAVAAVLFCGIGYSRAVRHVALGHEFRYVPSGAVILVVSGEIEEVWGGLETRFGRMLGEALEDTDLQDSSFPTTARDLVHYGIDPRRGAIFSLYGTEPDDPFLAVLPASERHELLLRTLESMAESSRRRADDSHLTRHEIHLIGDSLVAFPEPGIAVLSNSPDLLTRSLADQQENLRHVTNDDAFYRALTRVARGPLLVGPNVFFYWQSRTAPFANRSAILRFDHDELRVEGEVELSGGTLRIFDSLRRPRVVGREWARRLPRSTLAVLVLQDAHLDRYQNVLLEQVFAPWGSERLIELGLPPVHRALFAVSDYEAGVPDYVLALWGRPVELEAMLQRIQKTLRLSRDRRLLQGAIAAYRQENPDTWPSLGDLERQGLLEPEPFSLLDRFSLLPDAIGDPELSRQDFLNPSYETTVGGHPVYFLTPPLGANDLRYRPELAQADPTILQSDRYRMAAVLVGESLWIATDPADLEAVLSSGAEAEKLASNPRFSSTTTRWSEGGKIELWVDVDELISVQLLHSAGSLEDSLREGFGPFDGTVLEVQAAPGPDQRRLAFTASLRNQR